MVTNGSNEMLENFSFSRLYEYLKITFKGDLDKFVTTPNQECMYTDSAIKANDITSPINHRENILELDSKPATAYQIDNNMESKIECTPSTSKQENIQENPSPPVFKVPLPPGPKRQKPKPKETPKEAKPVDKPIERGERRSCPYIDRYKPFLPVSPIDIVKKKRNNYVEKSARKLMIEKITASSSSGTSDKQYRHYSKGVIVNDFMRSIFHKHKENTTKFKHVPLMGHALRGYRRPDSKD